jgi:hypothetical protein
MKSFCFLSLLVGCSSISFNKRNVAIGLISGAVVGATVALLSKNKSTSGLKAFSIGSGVGAGIGATFVTTVAREPVTQIDATFFKQIVGSKGSRTKAELKSFSVNPSNVPDAIKGFIRAPKVNVGKTDWMETDGELHEPHLFYYYEEGGLRAP